MRSYVRPSQEAAYAEGDDKVNIALIFAGGVGSRMGSDTPKQFLVWNHKPILIQTLEAFENHPAIDEIVLACKEDWIDYTRGLISTFALKKVSSIVRGGATALDSQFHGLTEIERLHPGEQVAVLIHDGVRPLIDSETISLNIDSVWKYGNAVTVTKAIETVITISKDGQVENILDRDYCRMARAPQSFFLKDILEVHRKALKEKNHLFIDSASMMTSYGYKLHTVIGKPENIKVTTPSDYYMYLGICKEKNNGNEQDISG